MATYNKGTGNAGTLRQIITYTRNISARTVTFHVEFWILCSDGQTNVGSIGWTGTTAGTAVSGSVSLPAGFGSKKVAEYDLAPRSVQSNGFLSTANSRFIFAIPSTGTSGLGGPTSFTVDVDVPKIEYPAPSTPALPSGSSPSAGRATFSWSKPSGTVTGYRVWYWIAGVWTGVSQTGTSITLTGDPGDTISVQVAAYNDDNQSAMSGKRSVVTKAGAPSAPGRPSVSSSSAGAWAASWSAPSNTGGKPITGYNGRWRVNGGSWQTFSTTGRTAADSGNPPGATVEVQIQAENADAVSAWSSTGSVVMKAAAPSAPAKPTLASPLPGAWEASWSAPSSTGGKTLTGYIGRYRVDSGAWTTFTTSGTTAHASGPPGSQLDVQIAAKNADATGPWSATATITLKAAAYVGKGGSYPSAVGVYVGKSGAYPAAAGVYVGKSGSFVPAK
nr:fibronectin type III domain-containing protein [Microbacterium bovistercoris]